MLQLYCCPGAFQSVSEVDSLVKHAWLGFHKSMPKVLGSFSHRLGDEFPRAAEGDKKKQREEPGSRSGHRLSSPSNSLPSSYMIGQLHLQAYCRRFGVPHNMRRVGRCMGCTIAEPMLQPTRGCLDVTSYRSDLTACCRSFRESRHGPSWSLKPSAPRQKHFSGRAVALGLSGWSPRPQYHEITRRAGMWAAQDCLLLRYPHRLQFPSAG